MKKRPYKDKSHRENASQFFVAGELCRRGFIAVVTMGNSPTTDILCSNKKGTKFVHIQVKTYRPGDRNCSVGLKAEENHGENFFWVLCGVPERDQKEEMEFYIIPSSKMAKNVKRSTDIWMKKPGKRVKKHDPKNKFRAVAMPPRKNQNGWDISKYKDSWELIEDKL